MQFRTNVAGVAHMTNAFLPLLRAGSVKKVITLSTGLADPDFVRGTGFANNPQYAIAKGALNVLVAEYAAALADEGFVFLAISPGLVNTAEKPRECPPPCRFSPAFLFFSLSTTLTAATDSHARGRGRIFTDGGEVQEALPCLGGSATHA